MNVEKMNEKKFITSYMDLAGASESQARSVYIMLEAAAVREDYPGQAWSSLGDEADRLSCGSPVTVNP